jgi:hypothetical protein
VSRHDRLRPFAGGKIAAEHHALDRLRSIRNFKLERRAGVPVPDFERVDPMPVRVLAASEQEVDDGRCRALSFHFSQIAESLAKIPALGMRLKIEEPDHIAGGQSSH